MYHGNLDYNTAKGLKELRKRIEDAKIPSSKLDESINVATWNIREFGKKARRKESIHFIAEIIGQFDLVSITEVRRNLSELQKVLQILGPYWKVVYSDYTPDYGGNWERIAYVYDERAVYFTGLAAEADPVRKKKGNEYIADESWWRSPYIASFEAGNFDFVLLTTHIRWGDSKEARLRELENLAKWIEKRRKDIYGTDRDMIVMGDFNIESKEFLDAVTRHGLRTPKSLQKKTFGTNLADDPRKGKRYDQILHYPSESNVFTDFGGIIDFYNGDYKKLYLKDAPASKQKFTYELSDHLPLWVQLKVDISGERLDQLIKRKKPKN